MLCGGKECLCLGVGDILAKTETADSVNIIVINTNPYMVIEPCRIPGVLVLLKANLLICALVLGISVLRWSQNLNSVHGIC